MLKVLALLCILAVHATARTLTACQTAQELVRLGFPRNQIADWVCLVKFESAFNTAALGGPNKNGSYDHGLFQLNDRYWCNNSAVRGKDCNVTCKEVRSDDITAAATCAKKVYARHGFSAWYAWQSHCKGKNVAQYVAGCSY